MTNIARMHEWDGVDGFTVMALDWTAHKVAFFLQPLLKLIVGVGVLIVLSEQCVT